MSDINDIIKTGVGVIDYGICCDECGYEIEDDVTGYWRDGVTGVWSDVRYCGICVWDFVKQPKRNTAHEIWRRQDEARKEQERLSVPESERRRIREEREERERQSMREREEEMEEYRAWREGQDKKNAALNNILAKQESTRLQECQRLREEQEDLESTRLTCKYTCPEEHDPNYNYDSLIKNYDWLQVHANKLWLNHVQPITSNGVNSRSYDWDPKPGFEDDQLPETVEELYEYLDDQLTPQEDAIKIDEDFIYCETYDEVNEEYDYATEEEADDYLKNQDPCFMCSQFNYVNVMFDAGRMRTICRDCYPKVSQCCECETITKDRTCYNFDTGLRLCFDCNFKTEERVQMPLEEHLLVRRDIQHLRRPYFDVLVDYAELAEFTIFDAYRYKSKCHFYDCIQRISPSGWNAEETLHFCSRRHCEYADELGCHCHNVYDGRDYDDDYEEATCKICASPHEANVASRKALRQSGQGVNPIVSAICVFNEGIKMSNVLFTSLEDLREYFV
jgi:hypothetical protein